MSSGSASQTKQGGVVIPSPCRAVTAASSRKFHTRAPSGSNEAVLRGIIASVNKALDDAREIPEVRKSSISPPSKLDRQALLPQAGEGISKTARVRRQSPARTCKRG
jgi:hypothetical protein